MSGGDRKDPPQLGLSYDLGKTQVLSAPDPRHDAVQGPCSAGPQASLEGVGGGRESGGTMGP